MRERHIRSILSSMSFFYLNAINTVDAVDEQDEDEDEGYLKYVSRWLTPVADRVVRTFMPYWTFAMSGLSEMKLNSFLRQVNGIGMIKVIKITISNMRSINT